VLKSPPSGDLGVKNTENKKHLRTYTEAHRESTEGHRGVLLSIFGIALKTI
jgi:hypothetical protein